MSAGQNRSAPAYALYALSAYCLAIWIIPLPRLFRRARSAVLQLVTAPRSANAVCHDLAFRASVGICAGAAVNLAYAGFRMVVGLRYASVWFLSIAAYDLVLGLLRLSLILSRRRRADELRCYRRTAWLLFLLIVPMGGMILLMVLTDSGYSYPGYVIYVSALYTFCMMGLSVRNLVKYRRPGSPILSAAKILNVIAALMSVLGLPDGHDRAVFGRARRIPQADECPHRGLRFCRRDPDRKLYAAARQHPEKAGEAR